MLTSLKVKNLAVVEHANVDFTPGLNVITGETGSGKSVFIGALSLLMGERADRTLVRTGENELTIEGRFILDTQTETAIGSILSDAGIPECEEHELVVRRIVNAQGTSRCWINDTSSTAQTLRKIATYIIDLHGPYDHQSLLKEEAQLHILDSFANLTTDLATYKQSYATYLALLSEREALLNDSSQEIASELETLTFIVDEIDKANLTEEDGQSLIERHTAVANSGEIVTLGSTIVSALTESDTSAFSLLTSIKPHLSDLTRIYENATSWQTELDEIILRTQELSRNITDALSSIEGDDELLARLDERLTLVQHLKRKYGQTIPDILAYCEAKRTRLNTLKNREKRLASLDGEIAKAKATATIYAQKLTHIRKEAATTLSQSITQNLRPLGFLKSDFSIQITPHELTTEGADKITFTFCPNVGETPQPLANIASTGEIARVMLAIKTVLAHHDLIPTLVFDEIDSNIGGEIGRAVGCALSRLSQSHQVISITHLPQVASYGDTHHTVTKRTDGNRTTSGIITLNSDAMRAKELSRMLGGADFTSVALTHAQEMLTASRKDKANIKE